jgi:hypothetical protein
MTRPEPLRLSVGASRQASDPQPARNTDQGPRTEPNRSGDRPMSTTMSDNSRNNDRSAKIVQALASA